VLNAGFHLTVLNGFKMPFSFLRVVTPAQHFVLMLDTQHYKDQQFVQCWLLKHSSFDVRVLGTPAQHRCQHKAVAGAQAHFTNYIKYQFVLSGQ